ncbi:MAG TPA: proteasome ATPase, partial [Asanoa sp.]
MARSDDADARAARWEKETHDLSTQVAFLQEELALVRRRLTESPRHVRQLEDRLAATQAQLARVTENNERLVGTLKEARAQIVTLKEEIDRLAQPPSGYGVFLTRHDDGSVDVFTGGRKLRVAVSPSIEVDELRRGQEVLLNDALNVVDAFGYERAGEVVMLKEVLDDPAGGVGDRALVISHADEERIVHLAETLIGAPLRSGDSLMIEPRSAYAYERIPKSEVEELVLEEVPDVGYDDIGGLH